MIRRFGAPLLFFVAARLAGAEQPGRRIVINLDSGWHYAERSDPTPRTLDSTPAGWQSVTLPHTWNALDATDAQPGYRRGAGWYRRALDLTPYPAGSRFVLYFEGANTVADIFANGSRAGRHVGGYVGFDVDITPFAGRHTEVSVRVDNSDDPDLIPSDRSDFVIYGGLTRDVWLEVLPPVAIGHLEVTTPRVTSDSASTLVRIELANPRYRTGHCEVEAVLRSPDGSIATRLNERVILTGAAQQFMALALPSVAHPRLWSPGDPSLYRLVISLSGPDAQADRVEQRVGFRWYRFEANGPFFLNGVRLLLRGTQRHEDYAGLGGALPDRLHRRDLELIKAMGANFVRLAHYPQDPEVYRAADSLGLLIWDELPWDRGGVGGERWKTNTRRLLTEQIRQNIGHPSIILWSLGNEISDVVETFNRGDTVSLRGFLRELRAIAGTLDPDRPTAMRKFDAGADIVDVYSPSIWSGWYRGVYGDYEKAILDARKRFPHFLHMEYGADAHYGRHTETPITSAGLNVEPGYEEAVGKPVANIARDGDWSESYQTDLLDWHLMVTERQSWLAGNAQWIFRDFATPLRPENPIPYVNEKGLFTRDGKPKDAYFVYRSYWTTAPKFAYIVSHSWTERSGQSGTARSVRVYSNCGSVELVVNAKSNGSRQRVRDDFPGQGLRWDVTFSEGANRLVARCTGAGENGVADSLAVHYTTLSSGRPERIALSARALPNGHLLIEARLLDGKNQQSLEAADRVYFNAQGSGRLLTGLGTPTGSAVIEAANGYAAIEFAPPPADGRATIVARTQELNGAKLDLVGSDTLTLQQQR